MPHPVTPLPNQRLGEAAYEAYWHVLAPLKLPWPRLAGDERRAWQAAARAAIRIAQAEEAHAVAQARAARDAEERSHDRAVARHRRAEDKA